MIPLQLILTTVSRSAGKVLNMAFGWATMMLFGKIPEDRQTLLSLVGLGSLVWLVVALGVAFPRLGAFLLAFNPLPASVNEFWIRLAMFSMALLLPAGIGALTIYLVDKPQRPRGAAAKINAVIKGYPYTLGLALTLFMMIIFAPIMKIQDLLRRWDSAHVPMIVEAKDYLDVVSDIEQVLRRNGLETRREPAGWMLVLPTRVLTFFARAAVNKLVQNELVTLKAARLEVLLHPSDLIIRGRENEVARVRAMLTENLTFTKAYQTWSLEAHEIEDRLVSIWRAIKSSGHEHLDTNWDQLQEIERDMKAAGLPYEEWEVLFRERMTLECRLLRLKVFASEHEEKLVDSFAAPAV